MGTLLQLRVQSNPDKDAGLDGLYESCCGCCGIAVSDNAIWCLPCKTHIIKELPSHGTVHTMRSTALSARSQKGLTAVVIGRQHE